MVCCSDFRLSPMTPPRDNYTVIATTQHGMDFDPKFGLDIKTDDTTHTPREYANTYY